MNQLTSANSSKWIKRFAKTGLVAKGVVYCLTGLITLFAAFHVGNTDAKDADKNGIFKFVYDQPFGKALLIVVGLGLLCYALWRWIQAIKDTEDKGSDAKGLAKRFVYLFSGFVYASLSVVAIKYAFYTQQSSGNKQQKLAAEVINKPFGAWLLAAVATGMVIVGCTQIYRAISGKYKKYIEGRQVGNKHVGLLIRSGKAGYISRGIVWLVIAWLFFKAAYNANSREAGSTGSAFEWLQENTFGDFLLGAISIGLICYGVFMFVRARYQSIQVH